MTDKEAAEILALALSYQLIKIKAITFANIEIADRGERVLTDDPDMQRMILQEAMDVALGRGEVTLR